MLTSEQEVRLDSWILSQSDNAIFFLDSVDELKISQGSFRQALINLRKGIADQSDRARIVINPAFKKVTFIYNSSTIKYAAYAPRLGMYLLAGLISQQELLLLI